MNYFDCKYLTLVGHVQSGKTHEEINYTYQSVENGFPVIFIVRNITADQLQLVARIHEFNKTVKNKKSEDVRYLKGLGSMNPQDWEWVYKNMNLVKIVADKKANKSLQIAMGENAEDRKIWLSTPVN